MLCAGREWSLGEFLGQNLGHWNPEFSVGPRHQRGPKSWPSNSLVKDKKSGHSRRLVPCGETAISWKKGFWGTGASELDCHVWSDILCAPGPWLLPHPLSLSFSEVYYRAGWSLCFCCCFKCEWLGGGYISLLGQRSIKQRLLFSFWLLHSVQNALGLSSSLELSQMCSFYS